MAKTKAKTTSLLENAMEESASEITALKAELKTKTDLPEVIKPKNNIPVQKDSSRRTQFDQSSPVQPVSEI